MENLHVHSSDMAAQQRQGGTSVRLRDNTSARLQSNEVARQESSRGSNTSLRQGFIRHWCSETPDSILVSSGVATLKLRRHSTAAQRQCFSFLLLRYDSAMVALQSSNQAARRLLLSSVGQHSSRSSAGLRLQRERSLAVLCQQLGNSWRVSD